jgi:NADH-quinone oxidoreductase subunit G
MVLQQHVTNFHVENLNVLILVSNQLHMNRCIMCFRCVKVAEQLTDNRVHGVMHRGDAAEISTYIEKAIENDFSGNVIDVCPVGALTDKTFRFKSRVWFTKPVDAHCDCKKCSGKVRLWMKGEEVLRVTARKDQWGEAEEFICNTCRFDRKKQLIGKLKVQSKFTEVIVISQNHYNHLNELKVQMMKQQKALGFMDINKRP